MNRRGVPIFSDSIEFDLRYIFSSTIQYRDVFINVSSILPIKPIKPPDDIMLG